ncbi:helix-turn-helix transcriptional regulator [Runella aurantiaca]|uniref:Helix-turn-helix domain-containing protein n=1 Tax=Runella aurantiaca TaxID=2282308 RepID=A0A369ICJ0_9BACT|nr:helix-turn-helix transcriptional regulator [Runella aurantiaca]RDB07378.1 helix-turn-helix domain-containing protein [Runella aurantiaca]
MSIVSDNMKYLRKLHGMTQDQFARRLGIKRASVGAYEEQRANPNIDVLKLMSKLFNVSVDDLLKKDLRKIRETPNLLPIDKPAVTPLVSEPKVGVEPQTLSSIFEQYYTPPAAVPRPQSIPAPPSVPVASVIEPPKPVAPVQPPSPAYQPPAFNNQYDNSNGATMVQMPTAEYEKTSPQLIPYVRQSQWKEYIEKHNNNDFIKRLPVFQWPLLPNGAYRAFEAGDDFTYPNAFLIGQFIGNWYDIADGKTYLLVARNLGVVCRRVYNQVKIKGTLLLSSDKNTIPTFEVPLKDVLEVWEIKAFFSTVLPEPTVSLDHLRHLVNQMQEELNQIKK